MSAKLQESELTAIGCTEVLQSHNLFCFPSMTNQDVGHPVGEAAAIQQCTRTAARGSCARRGRPGADTGAAIAAAGARHPHDGVASWPRRLYSG